MLSLKEELSARVSSILSSQGGMLTLKVHEMCAGSNGANVTMEYTG